MKTEQIKQLTGAELGYAGPIGLPASVRVIADNYVANRVNFECGANQTNYHNINVNFGRDLPQPELGDFKLAKAGEGCPRCAGKLQSGRGIEVGHIFKLGTKYSKSMDCRPLGELILVKYQVLPTMTPALISSSSLPNVYSTPSAVVTFQAGPPIMTSC